MNKGDADYHKENSEEKKSPSGGGAVDRGKKDEIAASRVDCDSETQDQEKWPNRVMAIVSVLLFIVTGAYTLYTRDQVGLASRTLVATTEAMRLNQRPWHLP